MKTIKDLSMTMTRPRRAILDGDIIAYRAAFWADAEGIEHLPERIAKDIQNWTPEGCTEVCIALSCPREKNYRRMFWPEYKVHRDDTKSPDSMRYALECIYDAGYATRCVDHLEADDLMGLLASKGDSISVTVDKDLRQVPGWHWNPDKEADAIEVSLPDADQFFYQQWMTGDSTDNIWGLWKVGPVKAKKVLATNPVDELDSIIIAMYEAESWDLRPEEKIPKDMTKLEFCLAQARSVRILRSGDYNKETKKISLWCPNNPLVRNLLDLDKGVIDE